MEFYKRQIDGEVANKRITEYGGKPNGLDRRLEDAKVEDLGKGLEDVSGRK